MLSSMAATTGCRYDEGIVQDNYASNQLFFTDLEANEKPAILAVLSNLLTRVVARNDAHLLLTKRGTTPFEMTVFHGQRAPAISIDKYLDRIFKYANCSTSCFVVAYAYIDRFIYQQPGMPVNSLNVHRLLITSVMVAAKFLDDAFYNNAFYAKIGGVTTYEMNRYCVHLAKEVAICAPYQFEKSLHLGCGLDETSVETKPEQQIVAVRCNYAGF